MARATSPAGPVIAGRAAAWARRGSAEGVIAWHFSTNVVRDTTRGKSMRRIVLVLISAFAAVVMSATAALADSPHFLFATNSIDTNTGR
jgi:hypothetical protein